MSDALDLPGWTHLASGKVRELYVRDGRADLLLLVASDRVSAYDQVLPTPVPDKGRVLTALSLWWFELLADVLPHHVVSTDVPTAVRGRALVCERLDMVPVECVARGYLAGSALVDYRRTGAVCGLVLPPGLREGDQLPEPVFTPATKAPQGGHDENVDLEAVAASVGAELAEELRETTLRVYDRAEGIARERGIVLADTKLELGRRPDATLVLADEVLTPDSSRFWPLESWLPGGPQPSFDKQYVRDWLTSPASGWVRESGAPPPPLPAEVVERTRERYLEAYQRLTGAAFSA